MHANPSYLSKSRHGIWYYRWVVPSELRARYPSLPKELKKSTGTADSRKARLFARRLHAMVWRRLHDGSTMTLPHDVNIRAMVLRMGPDGRPELQFEPHEAEAACEVYERMRQKQAAERQMSDMIARALAAIDGPAVLQEAAAVTSQAVALPAPPVEATTTQITVSEATEKFIALKVEAGLWTDETMRYSHEPSLRLFRELVGRPMNIAIQDEPNQAMIDLPLDELDAPRMERFLSEFRRFPGRQGRRDKSLDARAALEAGGPPQSTANFCKRLEHIRPFIKFCVDKRYVEPQVLEEIAIVMRQYKSRNAQSKKKAARIDGKAADGYVAFTETDLQKLFGPAFLEHVGQRAARYWIPLIALFTGLRVAEVSQLRPSDFEEAEGITCIQVRTDPLADSTAEADGPTRRVKTLAAVRTVPIHPELVRLGLLDYVLERRSAGQLWMWDGLLWTAKSGFGKYPSRDFTLLAKRTGVYVFRRKVLHSFRSTIAQALRAVKLEPTLIEQLIGHENSATLFQNYGRTDDGQAFPVKVAAEALALVKFPVFVPTWASLVQQPRCTGFATVSVQRRRT